MDRREIIKAFMDADGHMNDWHGGIDMSYDNLVKGAKELIAKEREECAKVCDELEASMQSGKRTKDGDHAAFTAGIIAERIRARGQA